MEKLSWEEIKQKFDGEWVQLTDCDWDMTEPEPRAGVVHVHAKESAEFHRLVKQNPVKESAMIFVGDPFPTGENLTFNANQHQWFGTSGSARSDAHFPVQSKGMGTDCCRTTHREERLKAQSQLDF